jgi:hypothetical protein
MTKKTRQTSSMSITAEPLDEFIGDCAACKFPSRVTVKNVRGDHTTINCLRCPSETIDAGRIYGITSQASCDPMCQSAIGSSCVCGCGGLNHGKGWSVVTGEASEIAVKLFMQRTKRVQQRAEKKAADKQQQRRDVQQEFAKWFDSLTVEGKRIIEFIRNVDNLNAYGITSEFVHDIHNRVSEFKPYVDEDVIKFARPLTERQYDALRNMIRRTWDRVAEEAVERPTLKFVPEGRYEVRGEIISARYDSVSRGPFRQPIEKLKILVKCDGFKLWGVCPDELTVLDENNDMIQGLHVAFTATVKRSDRDESFGFFKISKNARLIDELSVPQSAPVVKTVKNDAKGVGQSSASRSSHADCTHEATKAARAKCRRERSA